MRSNEPYRGLNFIVEIEGRQLASFNPVSGLGDIANELEHSVSRESLPNRKASGRQDFDIIRLVNGRASSADLYTWYLQATQGKMQGKRGSLIIGET